MLEVLIGIGIGALLFKVGPKRTAGWIHKQIKKVKAFADER